MKNITVGHLLNWRAVLAVLAGALASGWMTQAVAQDTEDELEEIVVTGSFIKRTLQSDSATSIRIIDNEQMRAVGITTVPDLVNTLTVNTGAQIYANNLEQPRNAGTTNINLRGLGEASTLVLLNGTRNTWTPAVNTNGDQYVDLSTLLPMIAVQRVEILKDGASSIYGSDAVAGVVNFITRDKFEGLEVNLEASNSEFDANQYNFGVILGGRHARGNMMAAFNYFSADPVTNAERWPDYQDTQNSITGFGNPSSIFNGPQRFVDPMCDAVGAQNPPGLVFDAFLCRLTFGFYGNVISEETRQQGYASGTYELVGSHEFFGEVTYARNEIIIGSVPTQPVTNPVYVPENHPDLAIFAPGDPDPYVNVGRTNPDNGDLREVQWFGRVRGAGFEQNNDRKPFRSWRWKGGLRGDLTENWDYMASYAYSVSETSSFRLEAIQAELQAALYGRGGPNRNEFFRFAWETQPLNSDAMYDTILGFYGYDAQADQKVFDLVVSGGDLWQMGGGGAGLAFGVQTREDTLIYDYNDMSEQFAFSFFIGGADFEASQRSNAVFGEIQLPFTESFTLNLSARWEEIEDASSTDPRITFLWTATDNLSFRGAWGTSFRVPSLFSQGGSFFDAGTGIDPQAPPGEGGTTFREENATDPDNPLEPQDATTYNFGTTYKSDNGFSGSLDYWNYEYDGYITYESSSAVLSLDTDPLNPSPQVLREPTSNNVIQVTAFASNAGFLNTDGIDLDLRWAFETGLGTITPFFVATYTLSYDLDDPTLGPIDGLGLRNFHNIGAPSVEQRANFGVLWDRNNHSANIFVRYVGPYESDELASRLGGQITDPADYIDVDSVAMIDLQYSYAFRGLFGRDDRQTVVRVGAKNVTGEIAPPVPGSAGYDELVHNPTGRWVYLNLTASF